MFAQLAGQIVCDSRIAFAGLATLQDVDRYHVILWTDWKKVEAGGIEPPSA